jgi:hypothetical protein
MRYSVPTNMAHSCPSRIAQPSAKLSSENVGSHQLSAHQHAIANARKAQVDKEPSAKSPKGAASHDVIPSTDSDGGNASDHELRSMSDATIPNQKKCHPIVVDDDDDNDENNDTSPISTQHSDNSRPKKKKKTKKHTSKST